MGEFVKKNATFILDCPPPKKKRVRDAGWTKQSDYWTANFLSLMNTVCSIASKARQRL